VNDILFIFLFIYPQLRLEQDLSNRKSFGMTSREIMVVADIITYYGWLFNVGEEELLKERRIADAISTMTKAGNVRDRLFLFFSCELGGGRTREIDEK
jgi:hypothetical protein